jgi:dihydrofolate synthase/folylpolyglutamate synthase
MRFHTLNDWLDWQQTLNPAMIDLGLDRVRQVYQSLGLRQIAQRIITVAGTNGKGSTVAAYEGWLKQSGYSVASYTSPHLIRYNERIKLNLSPVTDAQLCAAFQRVDDARDSLALTYFEFGTLAAMLLIDEVQPDFAILEVGLGGRLDAVNIVDPELAHITPIGLDHQQWLGDTRELIGYEKAGILRQNGCAVCNDFDPPESVLSRLTKLECKVMQINQQYHFRETGADSFVWHSDDREIAIHMPLSGAHQMQNMSGVLAGLSLLGCLQGLAENEVAEAFNGVVCEGRLQRVDGVIPARIILDVGHNEDAAKVLAKYLQEHHKQRRIVALLGMLEDKDCSAFVSHLNAVVDEWWLLDLNCERGLSAQNLCQRLDDAVRITRQYDSAQKALADAMSSLTNQDILFVSGSFMTVESVLKTSFF